MRPRGRSNTIAKWPRPVGVVGYALFLLIIAFAFTELGARALFPAYADDDRYLELAFSRLVNSPVVFANRGDNVSERFGFVLSPNAEVRKDSDEFVYRARTNSLGFRTKELRPRAENEHRLFLLGDSMFWGVGVESSDTIAAILEARGKEGLSVYNFSIGGYNTVQELIVARTYIDSVNPDQVILGVFVGNDILSNALTYEDADGNYRVAVEKRAALQQALRRRLWPLSASVAFRVLALPAYVPKIRYQLAVRDDIISPTYSLIDRLSALCRNRGIDFSVVILYPKDAVRGGLIEWWSQSRAPGSLIRRHVEQQGIRVLDLLDEMHGPADAAAYYFRKDGHPNAAGNARIAEAMLDALIR